MQAAPEIDQRVKLRADDGGEITSFVKGFTDAGIILAHPADLPVENSYYEGADLQLTWHAEGGVYYLPCRLVVVGHDGERMWEVHITGGVQRQQRRAYVRANVPGTITMRWVNKIQVACTLTANVDDLSEASVRFLTRDRSVLVEDMKDKPVRVGLEVAEEKFDLHGKVLRVARYDTVAQQILAPGHPSFSDTWAVYLLFVDHGKAADDLRRIVYKAQLLERQAISRQ